MNRFSIAAAVAATACIIGIPTVAALASDDSTNPRIPSHSRLDDRGTATHSDDATRAPSAVPTARTSEPGDDRGTHTEPGDDRGTSSEPGDDRGTHTEPGDDRSADAPGEDNSGPGNSGEDNSGPGNSGDDNGDHHGHGG